MKTLPLLATLPAGVDCLLEGVSLETPACIGLLRERRRRPNDASDGALNTLTQLSLVLDDIRRVILGQDGAARKTIKLDISPSNLFTSCRL